jgi:hypothetical protein
MSHDEQLYQLILWHLDRHQNLGIQDVYKLLYQGVFGAEHLVTDIGSARTALIEEWQRVPADANEILIEPVSMDAQIVRINIRRCQAEGLTVNDLWTAFYTSLSDVTAEANDFEKMWNSFCDLCRLKTSSFDVDDAINFGQRAKNDGWPARHHTAAYRRANYPAYRVVRKSEFDKIVKHNLEEF